jgi:RNA polymerase sigma-70 factor (sigma-E family)
VATALRFEDAFTDLWAGAYRVAFRLLGDREDAADCAQEACVRACTRWHRLVRQGDPAPWVVRVASNLAIDRWRRDRRRGHDATTSNPPPAMIAERLDLHRALAALAKRQREVVVLRFVADLRETDVAAALGISIGSVKQHAARGLAALRISLGDDTEDAR